MKKKQSVDVNHISVHIKLSQFNNTGSKPQDFSFDVILIKEILPNLLKLQTRKLPLSGGNGRFPGFIKSNLRYARLVVLGRVEDNVIIMSNVNVLNME